MDEAVLIKDALSGDLDAFNRLVLAYQDMAYNLAFRMLGSDAPAQDATQNAFLAAYRGLRGYRGGSFKGWLLRIVTNKCYDEMRRVQRHPTTPLEPIRHEDEEEIESPTWMMDEKSVEPEEALMRKDVESALSHCLETLPSEFRAVVIMIDLQGFDYEEVSEAVRTPLGTIKSRLARARHKLRDCLEGFGELFTSQLRHETEEHA